MRFQLIVVVMVVLKFIRGTRAVVWWRSRRHFSIRATRLKLGVPVSSSELSPPKFSF